MDTTANFLIGFIFIDNKPIEKWKGHYCTNRVLYRLIIDQSLEIENAELITFKEVLDLRLFRT